MKSLTFKFVVDFYMKVLGREAMKELILDEVIWWDIVNGSIIVERFFALIEDLFRGDEPKLKEWFLITPKRILVLLESIMKISIDSDVRGLWETKIDNLLAFLEKHFPEDIEIRQAIKRVREEILNK